MNDTPPPDGPVPAPTEPPASTGEGAQTALLALIRKRRMQADAFDDETLPLQPPGSLPTGK